MIKKPMLGLMTRYQRRKSASLTVLLLTETVVHVAIVNTIYSTLTAVLL